MTDEKKLIIDEDWKEEAKKEKEVLIEQEKREKDETKPEASGQPGNLPPADLPGLISMLATQAFFALGVVKTREDEEPRQDLDMAKFNIDMLAVIEEKTKGNLTEEEAKPATTEEPRVIEGEVNAAQKAETKQDTNV